jgi:hypothetical protein
MHAEGIVWVDGKCTMLSDSSKISAIGSRRVSGNSKFCSDSKVERSSAEFTALTGKQRMGIAWSQEQLRATLNDVVHC